MYIIERMWEGETRFKQKMSSGCVRLENVRKKKLSFLFKERKIWGKPEAGRVRKKLLGRSWAHQICYLSVADDRLCTDVRTFSKIGIGSCGTDGEFRRSLHATQITCRNGNWFECFGAGKTTGNRCSPASTMEDILPVCFQIRLIIRTNAVIFLVIFPFGRKLLIRPGTSWFVIQHFPLIEMVPDVLEAHQSIAVISINDLLLMTWLLLGFIL